MATPAHRQRQTFDRASAARRQQIALMVERLEAMQRTPARNAEQAQLKLIAIDALVEDVSGWWRDDRR
mgnify:CR=1 FL=1